MVQATYDPGNPYGALQPRSRVRAWVIGLPLLLIIGGLGYALLSRDKESAAVPVEDTTSGWRPSWQPESYKSDTAVVPVANKPDRTAELLKELQAQMDAMRKDLADLRKQPAAAPAKEKPTPTPQKKVLAHTPMLFIEHPPAKKVQQAEDLYWLGAGTWIPCTVEPHINSDVPGHFTLKTRLPVYDTETGHHLLIQQNQSIVGKDEAAHLLLGNERIPTFALTLSNPDGTPVDLGSVPVTDQLGTNGLTGEVNNHVWRLVWTSLFIGGLRGGQQALQATIAQGDPTTVVVSNVAGQLSQTGQQRLGRAQDTRPTIEVHSGSLCNVLLTKAIQLPELPHIRRAVPSRTATAGMR